MSLTFVTRKYVCKNCGHADKAYVVIKKQSDVELYFTEDCRPATLVPGRLYTERLVRDECGIISDRRAVEVPCSSCGSIDIESEEPQLMDTVSNFYPVSEAEKWFTGFARHIG